MPLLEEVETRTRSRACGDACDEVEVAAAAEGEEPLTRTRLEADARPTDADEGEAIVCRRCRSADSESLRGGGFLQLRCFSCSVLLGAVPF
jgi:hypothetical protein